MAGINLTGLPQTKDYLLGRGAIYAYDLDDDFLPTAGTHLGNAPEFNINVEVETLEHQSSLEGLKTVDLEVIISQKFGFSFQLDEVNWGNVARWLSGETEVFANAVAIAGFAEYLMVASVALGRWYDIVDSNGVRVYNIDAADVTAEMDDVVDVLLVEGTDYEIDTFAGRIFLKSDAVNIAAGDGLNIALAAKATAGTVDRVKTLTQTNPRIALKFIGENPANNDEPYELQIHKTSLKPDGDFALIGDEFAVMGFTGVAESNPAADADSPYATLSSLTP